MEELGPVGGGEACTGHNLLICQCGITWQRCVTLVTCYLSWTKLLIILVTGDLAGPSALASARRPTGPNSFIFAYIFSEKCLCRRSTPPMGPHPLWDPILLFSHKFLVKSTCIRGPDPPNGSTPPMWEILDPPLVSIFYHRKWMTLGLYLL